MAIAVLMPTIAPFASSERAAGVAGVDRGVRLDEVVQGRDRRRSRWSRPLADTMPLVTEFEYVPSGLPMAIDELADLERVGVAERGDRQVGRLDLDDGEVGEGVDAVDRRR